MFEIASMIGICRKLGYQPAVESKDCFHDVQELCPLFKKYIDDGTIVIAPNLPISVPRHAEYRVKNLDVFSIPDNSKIDSYMQKEYYFFHTRVELLNLFRPAKFFLDQADEIKEKLKYRFVIHYRGTDYCDVGQLVKDETYGEIYNFAKSVVDKDEIVIVTDDPTRCAIAFNNFCDSPKILNNSQFIDFCLLYIAEYSFVVNSSFSFWPRWLATGHTFIPSSLNNYDSQIFSSVDISVKIY